MVDCTELISGQWKNQQRLALSEKSYKGLAWKILDGKMRIAIGSLVIAVGTVVVVEELVIPVGKVVVAEDIVLV